MLVPTSLKPKHFHFTHQVSCHHSSVIFLLACPCDTEPTCRASAAPSTGPTVALGLRARAPTQVPVTTKCHSIVALLGLAVQLGSHVPCSEGLIVMRKFHEQTVSKVYGCFLKVRSWSVIQSYCPVRKHRNSLNRIHM